MVLLDRGGHGAPHAKTVATHDHWLVIAIRVLEAAVHFFGVLGTELKDVADLDASLFDQILSA